MHLWKICFMTNKESSATRLNDYITALLPWRTAINLKRLLDFVAAIIENQTVNQAKLARCFGSQEAAVKRLSRLIHNQRILPNDLAEAVLLQALSQLPGRGKIRLAIDWTMKATITCLSFRLSPAHGLSHLFAASRRGCLRGECAATSCCIKRVISRFRFCLAVAA